MAFLISSLIKFEDSASGMCFGACVLSNIFASLKIKFWTKKSRALYIKYLAVTAMQCTSGKQAEA